MMYDESTLENPESPLWTQPQQDSEYQHSVIMKKAEIGDSNNRRALRSENVSESIDEPTEVVFFAGDLRTDEELFIKAKKEILNAKDSKDVVFTGVEPIRGCRVADSLIEQSDIESIAARYDW